MVLVGVVIIAIWRYYHRKSAHEKALVEFDRTMLQSRLEIQEQTFKTISQELHDNFGQTLTLAKLNLNTLDFKAADTEHEKVKSTVDLLTQTIQSIRDLSKNLHADIISENGLIYALESELKLIEKAGTLKTTLSVTGETEWMDSGKSLIIFRIVQEALNNIVKHANATTIDVKFHFGDELRLTIEDNGAGFVKTDEQKNGSGLRNMSDRARVIGAQFNIQSADTGGTLVTLTIPNA
jgi:signal transduction histidine kinase